MKPLEFGKYKGLAIAKVPDQYLYWLLEQLNKQACEVSSELQHRREQSFVPSPIPFEQQPKITEQGQPCRKCGAPVVRKAHGKKPRPKSPQQKKPGGYYFEWWLKCPNPKCKTLYMVEAAKRLFEQEEKHATKELNN